MDAFFLFLCLSSKGNICVMYSDSCLILGSIHYEYDGQRKRTKYTVPQVDKGTSLHCYYVKMNKTGEYACYTCSTYFYIIAVKGCSFVYLRNCIFCPLSLSVMFIVITSLLQALRCHINMSAEHNGLNSQSKV